MLTGRYALQMTLLGTHKRKYELFKYDCHVSKSMVPFNSEKICTLRNCKQTGKTCLECRGLSCRDTYIVMQCNTNTYLMKYLVTTHQKSAYPTSCSKWTWVLCI